MPRTLILKGCLLVLLCLLLGTGMAQGHGYIVRSIPADRSVIERAPNQVQIWFSEGLERQFSTIAVFDQTGQQVDLGGGGVDARNSAKLVADLPSDLPAGAYLVRLRPVFTGDGHAVSDTMVFWVGEQIGGIEATGASSSAIPLEVVWRVLLTLALTVFFGTIWIYGLILRPIWGNPRWKLGKLPPRVMRRLSLLLWAALIIAFLTNLLALVQITISLFDTDLSALFRDNLFKIVIEGTNFGSVWQVRMLLLVMMIAVQVIAAQQSQNRPQSTHFLWLLNGFFAWLALGTISQISHAAGLPFWASMSVLADFLHLSAVAAWIGGLFVLALILRPAIQPLAADLRGQAVQAVLWRFSLFAMIAVSIIIATGIYATTISLPQPANLTNTTYGLTLFAKWILMLPLLGLGAVHYLLLSPARFASAAARVRKFTRFAHFPQSIRLEAIFALLVMFAAGTLPATPPPVPADARAEVEIETQVLEIEGYTVELAISPAAVGANALDVRITRDEVSPEIEQVKMRFSYPDYGSYTDLMLLDQSTHELWVGASAIDRAGNWDALIDFTPAGEQPRRAALEWDFVSEVEAARAPSVLNWLTGFGIIAVLGVWITPLAYQFGTRLNWTPENILIAGLAIIITVGFMVGGAVILENTSDRVQERRDAPPDTINPVFADQVSVSLGKTLYEAECLSCHGADGVSENDDIPPLSEALLTLDDEDLYRLLDRGKIGQHPFGLELSVEQKWALINFLRGW